MTAVAAQWEQQQEVVDSSEVYAVTPEYVLGLTGPTDGFLCDINANVYGVNFLNFRVRSLDEGAEAVLFEVGKTEEEAAVPPEDDSSRFIRYHFGPEFLDIQTVGTTLEFANGEYPLHNFRMIERHYFRDQLIVDYDFTMPFVIPNTRNTWEMIYSKPELNDEWKAALISSPWETRSDSFYFVNEQLVMHNRAEYNYAPHA